MTKITRNPLGFSCAPNEATPEYIAYNDFKLWLAYGLMLCWLSHDNKDPNTDCNMARPVTREDVRELRNYFLDLVENVIVGIWDENLKPGQGWVDCDTQTLLIGNKNQTCLQWTARLDSDAMMFELFCSGSNTTAIWLSYDALQDRQKVMETLSQAR